MKEEQVRKKEELRTNKEVKLEYAKKLKERWKRREQNQTSGKKNKRTPSLKTSSTKNRTRQEHQKLAFHLLLRKK